MISFKDFISESVEDRGKLKAIFLAGTPGAGKSYTVEKINDGSIQPRIVNTDKSLEFLAKKFDAALDTDETASNVWEFMSDKTKLMTKKSLSQYVNGMLPLIIDGTSSNPNNLLMRVGILESLGYDVAMIYVKTDLDTAIKRVNARDRKVPEDFIRHVYDEMLKFEDFYKSKFNTFIEINNNDGELDDKAIMSAYKKSKSFFSEPVKNPVGQNNIEKLKQSKQKYLSPDIISISELEKKMDSWYRK